MNVTMTLKGANYEQDKTRIELPIDTSKLDPTWIDKAVEYGLRRFINDSHSDLTGQVKIDACLLMIKEMESGDAYVAKRRVSSGVSANPVEKLALDTIKGDLKAMFKINKLGGQAIAWAKHDATKHFFTIAVKDGKESATWDNKACWSWAEKSDTDYMANAETTLATAKEATDDIDLTSLFATS